MSEREGVNAAPLSDRVLTQLQETGRIYLHSGVTVAQVLDALETLGIDPNLVSIIEGGSRQIGLRVTGGGVE